MAQQVIDIPGVGAVEFPAEMSQEEVSRAAKKLYDGAQKPKDATPTTAPKWYQPGGDQLLDNVRMLGRLATNPEVAGSVAGLATANPFVAPTVAGLMSLARDAYNRESVGTSIVDATGHAAVNAVPAGLGKAAGFIRENPGALKYLAYLNPWGRAASKAAKAAEVVIDAANPVEAAIPKAFENTKAGEMFHYMTGTAMVDATPTQKVMLAKQRSLLEEIANNRVASEAAKKAADAAKALGDKAKAWEAGMAAGARALVGTVGTTEE